MIKTTASFFIGLALICDAYAGISGSADKREVIGWIGDQPDYVSNFPSVRYIWNSSPYSSIVQVRSGTTRGTGEFISPRHVLTNAHVAQECGIGGKNDCKIYTSNNQELSAREVFYGVKLTGVNGEFDSAKWYKNRGNDWAVLEIVGDYCHKEYRTPQKANATTDNLWRAGFGGLRVLDASDISAIRSAYKTYLRSGGKPDARGMAFGDSGSVFSTKFQKFFDEFKKNTGKDFIADYNQDSNTLKIIRDCKFTGLDKTSYNSRNVVKHSCDAWAGDSGSGIKDASTNDLVGLDYAGTSYITTTKQDISLDQAILAHTIYSPEIQEAIKQSMTSCTTNKPIKGTKPIEPKPIEQEPPVWATPKEPVVPAQNPVPPVQEPTKPTEPEPVKPTLEPKERELWGQCLASDLAQKPHAMAGRYIPHGLNDLECKGGKKCACAATACEEGWYLAASAKGTSNGYCRSGKCPKGKHPNIINGNLMTGCVKD